MAPWVLVVIVAANLAALSAVGDVGRYVFGVAIRWLRRTGSQRL